MKTFVLLYLGFGEPTQEVMDAWTNWFASIADKLVDGGSPLGPGREISQTGTKELPLGVDSITGYSIIKADDMDDAQAIAQGCPVVTSVRVYEAMSM
jgi:hypothetical protein